MSLRARVSDILFGIGPKPNARMAAPATTEFLISIGPSATPPRLSLLEKCILRLVCVLPGIHDTVRVIVQAYLSGTLHDKPQPQLRLTSVKAVASIGIMTEVHHLPPCPPFQVFKPPVFVAKPQSTRATAVPLRTQALPPVTSSPASSSSPQAPSFETPELFHSAIVDPSAHIPSHRVRTLVDAPFKSERSHSSVLSKALEISPQCLKLQGSGCSAYMTPLEVLEVVPPFGGESPSIASSNIVDRISFKSALGSPVLDYVVTLEKETAVESGTKAGFVVEPCHPPKRPKHLVGDIVSPDEARRTGLIFNGDESYSVLGILGEGGFGRVIHARSSAEENLAIKVFHKRKLAEKGVFDWLFDEKMVWERITMESKSPFLASLHASFQDDANVYFVTKLYPQTLRTRLCEDQYALSEWDMKIYAAELLLAIEDLHKLFIIHRDIKPDNIVISPSGHLCLIDYGMARAFDNKGKSYYQFQFCRATANCGTRGYKAPEMLLEDCEGYNGSVDIWAFGLVLLEMFIGDGCPYFNGRDDEKVRRAILSADIEIETYVSDWDAVELLREIFVADPSVRPTIAQIKNHHFFWDIEWALIRDRAYQMSYVPGYRWPKARRRALSFDCGTPKPDVSLESEIWFSDEKIHFQCPQELVHDPGHGNLVWSTQAFVSCDPLANGSGASYRASPDGPSS